jgi:hypothetical protein
VVAPIPVADRQERKRQVLEDLREGRITPDDAVKALKD